MKTKPHFSVQDIRQKMGAFLCLFFLLSLLYFWTRYLFVSLPYELDSVQTIYGKIPKKTRLLFDFSLSQPKLSYLYRGILQAPPPLKRFQIVLIEGTEKQPLQVSRLVGLPNDQIQIQDSFFYIVFPDQEKICLGYQSEMGAIVAGKIPEGSYLLLNDQFVSTQKDSRQVGFFSRNQLLGHLIYANRCPVLPFTPRVLSPLHQENSPK